MRGIMIHSLMARGVPYEDAFRAANAIRERVRGRPTVLREELASLLHEELGAELEAAPIDFPPNITVTGAASVDMPFSKGVLAQSLQAAAIDPHDAFDVARELERELRRRQASVVDRKELRELAYQTLARSHGPRVAERYLIWRRFQEPTRPVVLLLGGPTGAGKTALATEVAYRLGIARVLSTDSIRQIMRIMLSAELAPSLHASSYDAWQVLPGARESDTPVLAGFRAQAEVVSVGVRAMIDRAVAEGTSLVLDGVSLVPGLVDLAAYRDLADIVFLTVVNLDGEVYPTRFASRAREGGARGKHHYVENLDAILRIQDHLLELADQYDVPIVENVSFDRSVLSIIRHLTETLRDRHGFDASELL